jgi:uncharacterized phage protein gp47/JayE
MTCTGTADCTCGCCAGTSVETPIAASNRAGLPAVSFRVGTWASFKESMLANLSSARFPALQPLKTRSNDDFTIAFIDATATVLDILTFYEERLANEAYLRTATQISSMMQLSQLIGYQPAPGVAAATYVAFTLQQTPGQPANPAAPPIVIPQGTQVQSVPPQGQQPQTFETSADILAKPDWNKLQVQIGNPWAPQRNDTMVWLAGTATQLQPGDAILVVGQERTQSPTSPLWALRTVGSVTVDSQNGRTLVSWDEPLGAPPVSYPQFFAFRQRASLFGYNSVQPRLLNKTGLEPQGLNDAGTEWEFARSEMSSGETLAERRLIDFDAIYSKIVPGGWVALSVPDEHSTASPPGFITLYGVTTVAVVSRSDFGMSARISRVLADTNEHLFRYYVETRKTAALVQSEALATAEEPLLYPLYGSSIALETLRTDLAAVTAIAVTGKRQKLVVLSGLAEPPIFTPDDPTASPRGLPAGEVLTIMAPAALPLTPAGAIPTPWNTAVGTGALNVADGYGRTGTVVPIMANFALAPSIASDPMVMETVLVGGVDSTTDPAHTAFKLKSPLLNCYERLSTTVNANVGLATAGSSVTDILGSGAAATADQTFSLRQSPLTYVQAVNPSGYASTLKVQVNGVTWTAVPSLYNQPPTANVYTTVNQPGGSTIVMFGGDGAEGAPLPSGQNNVQASYRIGSGTAGNVAASALVTLVDRPLGVSGVTNPLPATGGQDPQTIAGIKANAPQTVLTLGRAVSITDYQNFASSFAGIAKAYAIWIPYGPARGIFMTVAGTGGATLPPGNPTLAYLVAALQQYGNPLIPISAQSYVETLFNFSAALHYDPNYDQPTVQAAVMATLASTFGFAVRTFGQSVSVDQIAAVIQAVPGVTAVNVTNLLRGASSTGGDLASLANFATTSVLNNWLAQPITLNRPFADTPTWLGAYLPVVNQQSLPQPAEILVIDPEPGAIVLGTLP